jgi:tyrosine decarboxylase/aspartate 1-decarboxylase
LPESAHFSFIKICNLLRLKPVWANLDESFRADSESVQEKINKNTVAIVGTAGTAELGAIDPIYRLSATAEMNSIFFHVDAAFGGLIIPFMKDIGFEVPEFDFTLKGVNSMTVDPHKMGMTPICAGGILFRDDALLDFAKTDTPYLTQEAQYTFVGSRSGASAAATWASLELMGRNGFRKVVKRCIGLTESLSLDLESSGFELVTKPSLNIVAFRAFNARLLASKLRERGWWVSYVPRYDCVRIVIMPHTKKSHLTAFMNVLREVAQSSDRAFKGFS